MCMGSRVFSSAPADAGMAMNSPYPASSCATRVAQQDAGYGEFMAIPASAGADEKTLDPMHIFALPLHRDGQAAGTLALFHDTSYIDTEVQHTLRDALFTAVIQTVLISGLAIVLVRWNLTTPLARTDRK